MAILSLRDRASLLSLLVVCIQVQSSYALTAQYCSTQNTGGGALPNSSIYQSNGLCHDVCLASYAFAVVQGQNCWCSNYAPAAQLSTNKCDTPCPGYPNELCGNEGQSLYGYIALNVAPSGTLGLASSSTAASTSQLPSSTSGSAMPTSSAHKTASTSQTPSPVTQVNVVTQSGQIITQTITTTPTIPASANQVSRKSGIAPGYIAAAVIAGLLGLVFILAGIWLFMRRKADKDGEKGFQGGSSRDMQRNVSVHSKAGLLANKNGVPAVNPRQSGLPLMDGSATPISPVSERRKSQPLIWDQRLNPNALMVNENGSRTSLNTIDDHRDYGRTLQVTNPDPTRTSFS